MLNPLKPVLITLVVSAAALFGGGMAAADDRVRVCFENWAPYYELAPDGTLGGPVIEVLDRIADSLGLMNEYVQLPYKRCLRETQTNLRDILLLASPQMPSIVESRVPLAYWQIVAVVRRNDQWEAFSDFRQFAGRTVGLYAGYTYPQALLSGQSDWKGVVRLNYSKNEAIGRSRMFRLLEMGRVDVAFVDHNWARRALALPGRPVKILLPPVVNEPSVIGYAPESRAIRISFERELNRLSVSGELDQIFARYADAPAPGN